MNLILLCVLVAVIAQDLFFKTIGHANDISIENMDTTNDGGTIVIGNINGMLGGNDIFLQKLSQNGTIQFSKVFGGFNNDFGKSIKQTFDGGYILTGETDSIGSGNLDCFIAKLTNDGSLEWTKYFGANDDYISTTILPTEDGGYIHSGQKKNYNYDAFITKFNSSGVIEWTHKYYGNCLYAQCENDEDYDDIITTIIEVNGSYVLSGHFLNHISGHFPVSTIVLIQIDSTGFVEWETKISDVDIRSKAYSMQKTNDGFIIVGQYDDDNVAVFKFSFDGLFIWSRIIPYARDSFSVQVDQNGDIFVFCDYSYNDGFISGIFIWARKLLENEWVTSPHQKYNGMLLENGKFIISGSSNKNGRGNEVIISLYDIFGKSCGEIDNEELSFSVTPLSPSVETSPFNIFGSPEGPYSTATWNVMTVPSISLIETNLCECYDTLEWKQKLNGIVQIEYNNEFYFSFIASCCEKIFYQSNDTTNFFINNSTGQMQNNTVLEVGKYYMNITASTGGNKAISSFFIIDVKDTITPVWISIPKDQNVEYDVFFQYQIQAFDLRKLYYSINDTTSFGITEDGILYNNTRLLIGTYNLQIVVSDEFNSLFAQIKVIVIDSIKPVWIQKINETNYIEYGEDFYYQLTAFDKREVSFYVNDTKNFMIDNNDILKNNSFLDIGIYFIELIASDGYNNNSIIIKIKVDDRISPVWLTLIKDQEIEYCDTFSYEVNAFDLRKIQYSINDTENFSIDDQTGEIVSKKNLDVGTYGIEVIASDGINSNFKKFTVFMKDNSIPKWSSEIEFDVQNLYVGEYLEFKLIASDQPDCTNLEFSIDDPDIFIIDNENIIRNKVPFMVGSYSTTVYVSDGSNSISNVLTIIVKEKEKENEFDNSIITIGVMGFGFFIVFVACLIVIGTLIFLLVKSKKSNSVDSKNLQEFKDLDLKE